MLLHICVHLLASDGQKRDSPHAGFGGEILNTWKWNTEYSKVL